jgi:tripartite-type tricarboxylate transporter receptor subunit TctC
MPTLITVLAAVLGAILTFPVSAQPAGDYPNRTVRIVVPYPPGGGTDVLSRLVGRYLGDLWKQSVVVDNRPGGNALIGLDMVAKSNPDGYTLGAVAAGPLNDDNLGQFAPIALYAAPSYLLIVNPGVKANSVRELIELARAQPGKLNYGSTGGGAASHLATELFKAMANVDIVHIPYKGIGQATTDLMGGQVQMMIAPSQAVIPHVQSGKLRALGVTGRERSPSLPDVPTIAESGLPGYEASGWFGLLAPAGTPSAVVDKISRDVNGVLQLSEVKETLAKLGAQPASTTPQSFTEFIRADNAKWAKLIRERGIVIERPK